MKSEAQQRKGYLALIISIAIILIVTLSPVNGKMAGNYLDKVGHFLIFLNLGIQIGYNFTKRKSLILAIAAGLALGVLTEVLQQHIPGRNFEMPDILADSMGLIIGVVLYMKNENLFNRLLEIHKD